jgi:hypothetical protein
MTEPLSTKVEPFTNFTKQEFTIFYDEFCHERLFVWKSIIKNDRSILKLKETVTLKNGVYNFVEDLGLWFKLPKAGTLYARLKPYDYVKLHYDDGVR